MVSLALKLVADVLIVLVAVWVIFSIFKTFLPSVSGPGICKFYQVILTLPLPSFLKPNVEQCNVQPQTERISLADSDQSKVADDIETYIYKCWHEKANDGNLGITFLCYEIYFPNISSAVSESDITTIHKAKGFCNSPANNFLDYERKDYDCGNSNDIYWNVDGGTFGGTDVTVDISYDATFSHHRIEVS